MKRLKLFIVNTVILIVTSLLIHTVSTFFEIYIGNKIGTEGIGLFHLIMSVYFLAITIATSGIELTTTRIVSEELAINHSSGIKVVMKKCISYSLFFGFISSIILYMFSPIIVKNVFNDKIHSYILNIIAFSLPFSAISATLDGYFMGIKQVSKNSLYDMLNISLKIVFTFILLSHADTKNLELTCAILVIANVASEIISFLYLYILYLKNKSNLTTSINISENYLVKILKISLPVAITSYIRSGLSTIKNFLIPLRLQKYGMSYDLSLSSYGMIHGMALPLLLFPGLIINSISSLLIPEFARYNTKKDFKRMGQIINVIFSITILFSTIVVAIYMIFNKEIATLTYKNLQIGTYLFLLAPLSLFMYLDHIVDAILKGIDKQVGVMYCNIIDLFFSIILIYTLIPLYGINAYIFILYISEIFNFSISVYQLRKATNFSLNIFDGCLFIIKPIYSKIVSKHFA